MPLLTIVFTDVVESSATKRDVSLGRDSRERDQAYLKNIQTRHFSLIRERCQAHGGNEVSTMGDAFYLTFEDPVRAVRCAAEIQRRLTAEPIETPRGPLRLRIGIHSGFPESFEGGWHGTDVDTAARVEATATAQQILLSSRTYELVRHMSDVKFHFCGEFALKGVDRVGIWEADWDGKGPRRTSVPPLSARQRKRQMWLSMAATVLVLIAAYAAYHLLPPRMKRGATEQPGPVGTARPSVAVLEFKNLGGPSDAWLGTALAEKLTTELAAGDRVRTVSGNDVATTTTDLSLAGMITFNQGLLAKVHTNLGSDYIVRGSYSSSSSAAIPSARAIHVDLQLQPTQSGETASSFSYDGTVDQISELVERIGTDLRQKLGVPSPSDQDSKAAQAASPSNPEALQRYAEGLKKLRTLDALGARDDLQAAVQLEPHYALAHAALADAWQILGYDKNAEEEAKNALDNSKTLGMVDRNVIEARYSAITHNWDRAIEIYQSLWGLNHDEPKYLLDVAEIRVDADMGDEALKMLNELRKAEKDADKDPRIDYEEALADEKISDVRAEHIAAERAVKNALAEDAQLLAAHAYWQDCGALLALGDLKEAEAACQNAKQRADSAAGRLVQARALTNLGRIMQQQGKLSEALELHKTALATAKDIGSQKDIIGALLNIAEVQSSQGQIAESQKNQDEAIEIAKRIGDTQQILIWENLRGADLYTQGDYTAAKAIYDAAIATGRTAGDRGMTSDALQNLGILLFQTGDLAGADQNLREALTIAEKAHLQSERASALANLGDVAMARGELGNAQKSYQDALALSTKIGDQANIGSGRLGLAKLALEKGDAAESVAHARQAIDKFQATRLVDSEGDARNTLAHALMAQGKLAEAQSEISGAEGIGVQDQIVKLSLAITAALLKARMGRTSEAQSGLSTTLAGAEKLKLVGMQFEVRLAQGEIEESIDSSLARAQLRTISQEARTAGYLLVAVNAARKLGASAK